AGPRRPSRAGCARRASAPPRRAAPPSPAPRPKPPPPAKAAAARHRPARPRARYTGSSSSSGPHLAPCAPVTALQPLESPFHFPVGHDAVVFADFPLRGMDVMVHHVLAEGGAEHLRLAHQRRRLAERMGDLPYAPGVVDVAGDRGLQFQLLLDP